MRRIREALRSFDLFDGLALALMLVVLGLALSHWSSYPVHMDTYYHIGVTSGYSSAGGISLHSFWEFAPAGRAQLYPPLLHVIMYTLNGLGLSMLTTARLVTFAAFPLLVLSGWFGMRRIFSSRSAFYTVVLLCSCYLLFWHSAVESAASLVLILTPLVFVAVERNRKVAAAVLLALALYSHLTLGHLVALGLLIYAIHRRDRFKEILLILVGAYLLWLPWGVHILMHRNALSFSNPTGTGITVHILVWGVALAGFVYCYFKKDRYYLLPAFLLGFVPIVFFYPDRFWNAHVFLPLAMLGGVALSGLHGLLGAKAGTIFHNRAFSRAVTAGVMAVPVALLLFLDPVFSGGGGPGGGPQQGMRALGTQSTYFAGPRQGAVTAQAQVPVLRPGQSGNGSASPTVPPNMGGDSRSFQPPGTDGTAQTPPTGKGNGAGVQGGGPPGVAGNPGMMDGPGGGGNSGLHVTKTTILSLLGGSSGTAGGPGGRQSVSGSSLIGSDDLALAELIEANSGENDIVHVTDGGLGNMITGLTGRASTGGMFHEVSSEGGTAGGNTRSASLVVVGSTGAGDTRGDAYAVAARQANRPDTIGVRGQSSVDTSGYELVGTAGNYTVYRNTAAAATAVENGTVIPWYAVYILLALALIAILVDWFRPGPDPLADSPATGPAPVIPPTSSRDGRAPFGNGRTLAIVPCYNEAPRVSGVVEELRSKAPGVDILVIDDGSSDRTAEVAWRAGAVVMRHRGNAGVGAAMRTGMSYACDQGYRFAVQVDGDGQHDPSLISVLLRPLVSGAADVAVGSRFLGTDGYKPPLARRVGTLLLAGAVRSATGHRVTDTTSGFRAMNRRAFSFLAERYPDGYPEAVSLVLLDNAGLRWEEVPVAMRKRTGGTSTISVAGGIAFVARTLAGIARESSKRGGGRRLSPRAAERASRAEVAGAVGAGAWK